MTDTNTPGPTEPSEPPAAPEMTDAPEPSADPAAPSPDGSAGNVPSDNQSSDAPIEGQGSQTGSPKNTKQPKKASGQRKKTSKPKGSSKNKKRGKAKKANRRATNKALRKARAQARKAKRVPPGPLDGAPRFVLTVVGSLLLASPRLVPALSGQGDPVDALVIWLAAIAVTFVSVSLVAAALRPRPAPENAEDNATSEDQSAQTAPPDSLL